MHRKPGVVHIVGEVGWKIQRVDGGLYVGVCEALNLTMQGDTWADLMQSIGETLDLLFKDLCETGELNQFLRDHGWHADGQPKANATFDLPFLPVLAQIHAGDSTEAVH